MTFIRLKSMRQSERSSNCSNCSRNSSTVCVRSLSALRFKQRKNNLRKQKNRVNAVSFQNALHNASLTMATIGKLESSVGEIDRLVARREALVAQLAPLMRIRSAYVASFSEALRRIRFETQRR